MYMVVHDDVHKDISGNQHFQFKTYNFDFCGCLPFCHNKCINMLKKTVLSFHTVASHVHITIHILRYNVLQSKFAVISML